MDLPWNPAVLEQRIGRIYRQGQKKNVNIVNFVAQHTIEHGMLGKLKFKAALAEGVLDNGESNIFIGDSKFNVFMQGIEGLLTNETVAVSHTAIAEEESISAEKPADENEIVVSYDDDDVKQIAAAKETLQGKPLINEPENAGQQLIQTAASFFTQLGSVLSDPKATESLVQSLIKKDETTGQTYLQIPVDNEVAVKNVVGLLAGLFKGFTGK